MRTYCKSYPFTKGKIYEAYSKWLTKDSGKENKWRVEAEYGSIHNLVDEIYNEINTRTLSFRPIVYHKEAEKGSGKIRNIGQQSVKQQICDYLVLNALEPMLEDKVGYYQVGGVEGRGPLRGAKTIKKWLNDDYSKYYISADYIHCYEETPVWAVVDILCKYVKCSWVYYTACTILDTYGYGLEIGSVFSLKMSLLVLSFVYHYIEDLSKVRRDNRIPLVYHQIWYADNFYIFSNDKRNLRLAMKYIEQFSKDTFSLSIHDWKVCMANSQEPVDFAGFRVYPDHVTIRDKTYLRIRKAFYEYDENPTLKKARTVCSYWGKLKHTDSYDAIEKNDYYRIKQKASSQVSRYDRMRARNAQSILRPRIG